MGKFNIEDINIQLNVNDLACIIEPGFEERIDNVISSIEARTTAEVAVVTLDSLKGMSINEAALRLFNKLGVGKKKENNGVLILISNEDGQFRIQLGLGMETIIDERMRKALVEKIMLPELKREHYGPAILRFLKKVSARITRSKMSNISLASWLSGILSMVFTATGIFSSIEIVLTSFPDIEKPEVLILLFVKTCIIATLLAIAAIVLAIADFSMSLSLGIYRKERIISRSIAGAVMGMIALIIIFIVFFFFPLVTDYIAEVFSLSTGDY